MKHSRYEIMRLRREREGKYREEVRKGEQNLVKIQGHPETTLITKETMPDAFQFVEDLLPGVAPTIAITKIYRNTNTAFAKKVGIPEYAGGVYFPALGSIVICWNRDNLREDCVVVHELLHYASHLMGSRMRNEGSEEYFAYTKSIPFLISKGYSREFVAEKYLLPFFQNRKVQEFMRSKGLTHSNMIKRGEMEELKKETIAANMLIIKEVLDGEVKRDLETDDADSFEFI